MTDCKKSVKSALIITYISMVLLLLFVIFLPLLVQYYVEIRGKDPNLATTIMLTCYPCVPFAAVVLYSLRGLLKNVLAGLILGDKNIKFLRIISICLLLSAIVMFIGGFKYMPFFISAAAALICGLIVFVLENVLNAALSVKREEEFKDVRNYYEKNDNLGNR